MNIFTRMVVCAGTAVLFSGLFFHLANSWCDEETNVMQAGRRLLFETRRAEALQERKEMVSRSLEVKRSIVADLAAGRLHLAEAIDQFNEANHMIQNINMDLIPMYRLPTDAAGVGRQVLVWVRNEVALESPEKARRLVAELGIEYQKMFGKLPLLDEEDEPQTEATSDDPPPPLPIR